VCVGVRERESECECGHLPAPGALLLIEFPSCRSIRGCEDNGTSLNVNYFMNFTKSAY